MNWVLAGNIAVVLTIGGTIWQLIGFPNFKELLFLMSRRPGAFKIDSFAGKVFSNVDLLNKWGARELDHKVFTKIHDVPNVDPKDRFYVAAQPKGWIVRSSILAIHRGRGGLNWYSVFKLPRDWRQFASWTILNPSAKLILAQPHRLCFIDFSQEERGTIEVYGEADGHDHPIPMQEVQNTRFPSHFSVAFGTKIDRIIVNGTPIALRSKNVKVALKLVDNFKLEVNQHLTLQLIFQRP